MISVIIPAYNDEESIQRTIAYVYANATAYKRLLKEVIVVDGGSTDKTVEEAQKTNATIIACPSKERMIQLNYGARQATGKILYFLHAHSLPPKTFISEIVKAYSKGYACGTFSLKFNHEHWLLNLLSWFTKHNSGIIHISDQSLYLTKELYDKSGGFREDHYVMANQEMIRRLKRYTNFIVIKDNIISSAKKYLRHGIFRTEFAHALAFMMSKLGYPPQKITRLYRKWLVWKFAEERKQEATDKPINDSAIQTTGQLKNI